MLFFEVFFGGLVAGVIAYVFVKAVIAFINFITRFELNKQDERIGKKYEEYKKTNPSPVIRARMHK
jgi:hypothetical protein